MFFCLIFLHKQEATGAACCRGWEKPSLLLRQGEQSRNNSALAALVSSCYCCPPHSGFPMVAQRPPASVPVLARGPEPGPPHGRGTEDTTAPRHPVRPPACGGAPAVCPSLRSASCRPSGCSAHSWRQQYRRPWEPGCPQGKGLWQSENLLPTPPSRWEHGQAAGPGSPQARPSPAAEWRPCLSTREALSGPSPGPGPHATQWPRDRAM